MLCASCVKKGGSFFSASNLHKSLSVDNEVFSIFIFFSRRPLPLKVWRSGEVPLAPSAEYGPVIRILSIYNKIYIFMTLNFKFSNDKVTITTNKK